MGSDGTGCWPGFEAGRLLTELEVTARPEEGVTPGDVAQDPVPPAASPDDDKVARARYYVEKWAPAFGAEGYRFYVKVLPKKLKGVRWADCEWRHDERWASFRFCPDGTFPDEVLEVLVLHEMSHGLFWLGAHKSGEETACNIIVAMALNRRPVYPNEWRKVHRKRGQKPRAAEIDQRSWLALVVDGLPQKERDVLTGIYWRGASLSTLGKELGVSKRTVSRLKKKGLKLAQRAFEQLERS